MTENLRDRCAKAFALAEKATPGPWRAMQPPAPSYSDHGWRTVCETKRKAARNVYTQNAPWTDKGWSFGTDEDAEFIAAHHEDVDLIRDLLARLDELEPMAAKNVILLSAVEYYASDSTSYYSDCSGNPGADNGQWAREALAEIAAIDLARGAK